MIKAFCVRWLQAAGLTGEEARQRVVFALERVSRYPFPMPLLYRLSIFFLEYFGPLFSIGKLKRASTLNAFDYEKFEQKFHNFRFTLIRGIFILARAPLWEQLAPEQKPELKSPHPLAGKLSVPAKGDQFDVIIIGSGAGGAPLAWKLAHSGIKVALIESGGLVVPQTTAYALEHYYLHQTMDLFDEGWVAPCFCRRYDRGDNVNQFRDLPAARFPSASLPGTKNWGRRSPRVISIPTLTLSKMSWE